MSEVPPLSTFLDQPFQGRAAFVPLDYGSRYEHSVLVVPDRWDDLFTLLYAPKAFLAWVREGFQSTPSFRSDAGEEEIEWLLNSPATVVLSPFDARGSESLLAGPGSFLLEFALETSVLIVRYVPPAQPRRRYLGGITPATLSSVEGTRLNFTHFDVDFGDEHTFERVARLRAEIAVDLLEDPTVLNEYLARSPSIVGTGGSWTRSGSAATLMQTPASPIERPRYLANRPITVVLDSVWTDFDDPIPICPGGRAPYLCSAVETETTEEGEEVSQALIKWYCPPTS